MALIKDSSQKTAGDYLSVAPSFVGTTPANATAFTVTSGTNATYATFQAVGAKGGFIRYELSGNVPTGVTLNAATGALSGTEPQLIGGMIGGPNGDVFGKENGITLSNTYGGPTRSFSFTVTAKEFSPTLATVGQVSRSYTMTLQTPFKFRQILTRGFVFSGYRSSVTYRNCNRVINATDTTTNIGDQVDRSYNYKGGLNGHSIHYALGSTNAHNASSNYTSAFNMRTETQFGNRMNANASMGMSAPMFSEWYYGWATGGGFQATEEYNLTTETRTSNNVANSGSSGAAGNTGGLWAMNHETYAITYDGGYHRTFTFSTRSYATRSAGNPSNNMQQKAVQSKNGFAWAGGDGSYSGGYFFRKTNLTTNTLQSSNIGNKPAQNTGEENPTIGQDHQYVLGTYDGSQNNRSWRYNYATDSGFEGGSTLQGSGVPGRSSATNGWID